MSRYEAYPEYKDSGLEWLEDIPTNWKAERLFGSFVEIDERGGAQGELLAVSQSHGVMPQHEYEKLLGRRLSQQGEGDYSNYKRVKAGDFIYNRMRMWQGAIGVAPCDGIVSPAYVTFRARSECDSRYWVNLFKTPTFLVEVNRRSQGICDDQNSCKFEGFRAIVAPTPDVAIQRQIADSLASETTRIDALIEKKTRFIELLKEKRQALITHAVTKGLDPDVPMKDSGVEWIGEVPTHWRVVQLKRLVITRITDGPHETPELVDDGVPFVSADAVSSGNINFGNIRGYISADDHKRFCMKYQPRRGDVYLIKSGATTGNSAIVETDREFSIWSPLAAIRCDGSQSLPYFVLFAIRSHSFQDGIALNWSYGTQQNIGMGVIENLPMTTPSVEEQASIVSYITKRNTRIDTLIEKTERSIELLKEKRSALITAAVTGKIDVREQQTEAA